MGMLRPESEMKDSGIDWIGQIPQNWGLGKLKYLGTYINGYAFKPSDWASKGKPIIRIQDLTGSNTGEPNYYNGELDHKYLVCSGDILVSWAATLDAFKWDKDEGWLNQHIFKAIPVDTINKNYYLWLLKVSMDNMNNDNKHGIVMQHVTIGVFNNYQIPLAPVDEQQIIASYLDDRCSKLDEIITEAEKSIEEYKELKQAVIDNAITYGLNQHRDMMQSDCEWVRLVPVGWRKIKLGWICSFHNGDRSNRYPSGDDFINEGIPFAGADSLNGTFVDRNKCRFIKRAHYKSLSGLKIKKNDILYTLRGSTIGKCAISDFNDGTVASSLTGIRVERLDDVNPMFLLYWLQSICEFNQRTVLINGSTAPNLSAENVRQYKMFLPSANEQDEIVRYLNEAVKKYDDIIVEKQETVQLLSEYKKSLIYEVVTGKKRVSV